MVLGHSNYHYSHEPILYGYTAGPGRHGRGGEGWYGDNSQTSVIDVPKPSASTEHPTSKPVELIEPCLRNSTPVRGGVLDLFAGFGSTLIACENLAAALLRDGDRPGLLRRDRGPLQATHGETAKRVASK